jgi:hypothetical protein
MKKITTRLCRTSNAFALLLFLSCPFFINAQPSIRDATTAESVLELCASACTSTVITAVDVLNTDAVEVDPGSGDFVQAIVWSGATSSNGNVLNEALCVINAAGSKAYVSLPSGATYPDVVIGVYDNSGIKYRAAVVYELGDDIFLEVYDITNPASGTCSLSIVGSAREITDAHNDAHYPHIDLRAENDYVSGWPVNGEHLMYEFGICWYEINSGTPEVYKVEGNLTNLQSNYHTYDYVADGTYPDIALGGWNPNTTNMTNGEDKLFITYIDDATGDLNIYFNLGSITGGNTTAQLEDASNFDDLMFPRIEARLLVPDPDYSQAHAFVVAALDPSGGSTLYKVKGYPINFDYNPGHPPPMFVAPSVTFASITPLEISDMDNDAFYSNGAHGLMPSVCGTLGIPSVSSGGIGSDRYETMFYSDYTWHNETEPNNVNLDDGDFYSIGSQPDGAALVGEYLEANYYDLASSFSTSTLPALAIATSSNSGENFFGVWYDGDVVKYKTRTANNEWKPGKPNSIANTNTLSYEIYPNPVVNDLMVGNVKNGKYTVTNLVGQTMLQGTLSGGNNTVQMSQLSSGTYIFTIQEGNDVYRIKIVKQ